MTYMKKRYARSFATQGDSCKLGANMTWSVFALAIALSTFLTSGQVQAQTWSLRTSTTVDNLFDVAFSTAVTAASVGANSVTIASGDGGASWVDETVAGLTADGSPDLNAVFSSAQTIIGVGADQMGAAPEAVTVIVKIVDALYYAASATSCGSDLSSLTGLSQTSSTWSHVRVCRAHRWGFSALACS